MNSRTCCKRYRLMTNCALSNNNMTVPLEKSYTFDPAASAFQPKITPQSKTKPRQTSDARCSATKKWYDRFCQEKNTPFRVFDNNLAPLMLREETWPGPSSHPGCLEPRASMETQVASCHRRSSPSDSFHPKHKEQFVCPRPSSRQWSSEIKTWSSSAFSCSTRRPL